MDAKTAVEVLERVQSAFTGADNEHEALDMAIAALKAQGEPVYQFRTSGGEWTETNPYFFEGCNQWIAEGDNRYETRTLYTAPQPVMRPKRLEWNSRDNVWFASPMAWVDDYIIYEDDDGSWVLDGVSEHETLDEAKAAAQADFENQVMSCFEPQPESQPALSKMETVQPIRWLVEAFDKESGVKLKEWVKHEPEPEFNSSTRTWYSTVTPLYSQPVSDSYKLQPAQAVPGWQPIETAPKDGTRLLLFRASDEMQFTGSWCDCYGWSDLNAPIAGVTHWRPLPAAPAPGGDV